MRVDGDAAVGLGTAEEFGEGGRAGGEVEAGARAGADPGDGDQRALWRGGGGRTGDQLPGLDAGAGVAVAVAVGLADGGAERTAVPPAGS